VEGKEGREREDKGWKQRGGLHACTVPLENLAFLSLSISAVETGNEE
jgi:hypothetical protein